MVSAHAMQVDAVPELISGIAVGGNGEKVDPMIQAGQLARQRPAMRTRRLRLPAGTHSL